MALGENLADIALRFERVRTIWSRWDPKNLVTEIENMFKKLQHSTDAQKGQTLRTDIAGLSLNNIGWQQATHARDSEAEVSDRRLASHFVSYNSTAHGYGRVQHYGRAIRLAEGLNEAKRTGAEEAKLQYYIQMTYPKDAVIPNAQDSNWLFRRGQIQRGKYLGEKVLRFTEDYGRGMMAPLAICVPPSMLENWTRVEVSSLLRGCPWFGVALGEVEANVKLGALEIAENHECFVLLSRLVNIELERTQALGSAAPLALGWADEVLRLAEQHPHQSMDDDAGSDDSHATQENRSDNGSDDDRRDDNARERNDNNNNSPRSARMDEDEGQRHDHGNEMDVDDEQAGDERPPMASGALGSKRGSAGPDTE